jgi:hypothetical protein
VVVRRRAAVVLAGIGFLPGQPVGIPLLPAEPQLPAHYGDYTPTTQQLEPTLWFPPSATLVGLAGRGLAGLAQEQGSDGFISGTINSALLDSSGQTPSAAGSAGSALSVAAAPYGAAWYGCEQLPGQFRSGGEYWKGHASGRLPAVLPVSVPGTRSRGPRVIRPTCWRKAGPTPGVGRVLWLLRTAAPSRAELFAYPLPSS